MDDPNTPAFPSTLENGYVHVGMTLRDYFAAAAMEAMLNDRETLIDMPMDTVSKFAYRQADAMLKERAKL